MINELAARFLAQGVTPGSFFDLGGINVLDLGATGFVGLILWMLLTGKLVTHREAVRMEREIETLRALVQTQASTLATLRPAAEVTASLMSALQQRVDQTTAQEAAR